MNAEEVAALTGAVIDRTEQDVAYARSLLHKGWPNMTEEEKEQFLSGQLKGVYNHTDLNRVEEMIWLLATALTEFGYPADIGEQSLWEAGHTPTVSELNQLLIRVKVIRQAFATISSTPEVPDTMRFFTYEQANVVERILCDIFALASNMLMAYTFSGDVYGGEM